MKRFKFYVIICFFTFSLIWIGGFIIFDQYIHQVSNNNDKTDAIVVLTGGRNRISQALKLFNQNMAEFLIISGVSSNVTLNQIEKQNNVIIAKPLGKVIIGKEATTTYQNAIEVSEAIRRNNIHSVRLVTSYYHMPRSKAEILAHNPELKVVSHPVYSEKVSKKWWKRWNSFCLIASEYNKFMFVYAKYFILKLIERN